MFSKIYNLQSVPLNTYLLLCVAFILCCLVFLRKFLRSYYYISKIPGLPGYPIIGNALVISKFLKPEVYFNIFQFNDGFSKVWIGPLPVIFVSDPTILQTVLTNPMFLNKGRMFELLMSAVFKRSLVIEKVEKWKRNRKICNYAFTQTILNSFLPIFNNISVSLIEQLDKNVSKMDQFDVLPYFRRASLDSMCATTMGVTLKSLKETKSPLANAMDCIIKTTSVRLCSPWLYPCLIFNFSKIGRTQAKALEIIWDTTNKVFNVKLETAINKKLLFPNSDKYHDVDKPFKKNPLKKPVLDFLLDMMEVYPELTAKQIKDETGFLIMAGYETSAVTLAYALVALGAQKNIQEKVYNEIFNIFGNSDRPIELDDLPKLEYLELVIKETLRLYPPVINIIRENLDEVNLGGYTIPAETTFFISIVSTHRHPKYWEKPLEFIPERFLENRHPYAFIPFSGGPRNCIGAKYAMMFMKVQLVNILRKFEIHTTLKLDQLHFELDLSVKLLDGHQIHFTQRKIVS